MKKLPWTPEDLLALKRGREQEKLSYAEIVRRYLPHRTAASLRSVAQSREYESLKLPASLAESPKGGVLHLPDGSIELSRYLDKGHPRSLEELLAAFDVDLERWVVKKHDIRAYPIPVGDGWIESGWYCKANLEPNHALRLAEDLVEALRTDAMAHAPSYQLPEYPHVVASSDRHMLELDLFDHHFGMLAWGLEVDGASYDSAIASALYRYAVVELAGMAGVYPIERIVLILGNDLLHYDTYLQGKAPVTTAGTFMDADSRRRKLYVMVRRLMVEVIDRLRLIAPVEVVVVSGNHDEDSTFTLGDSLECWYHRDPAVTVNNSPALRKHVVYGVNLIGFAHGDQATIKKLPMLMATEWPEQWAAADYREWHIGHRHQTKRSVPVPLEDLEGVFVREMPSLCPPDSWHYRRGFTMKRRGALALLWHPEAGPVHEFFVNLPRAAEVPEGD